MLDPQGSSLTQAFARQLIIKTKPKIKVKNNAETSLFGLKTLSIRRLPNHGVK